MLTITGVVILVVVALWLWRGGRCDENGIGRFLTIRRITGLDGSEYLVRRYLLPKNRILNIYLHKFLGSDDDRALHDHPWISFSVLLKGELVEHLADGSQLNLKRFALKFRTPSHLHRIELPQGTTAITLFITGPVVRVWGFACPQGWMPWQRYHKNGGCD